MKKISFKKESFFSFLNKIKENKNVLLIIFACLVVVASVVTWKILHKMPEKIYEVAVVVRDQHNSDPEEDRRNSMKAGDVLVIKPEGQKWSQTERVSYLILKMSLTEEEKQNLTKPETQEIEKEEITAEELAGLSQEEQEQLRMSREEPEFKNIRQRMYRVKIEKFKDFKPLDLLKGQPYLDDIFDWKFVEKKK